MQDLLNQITETISTYIPNLLGALLVLVLGWLAALIIAAIVRGIIQPTSVKTKLAGWIAGEEKAEAAAKAKEAKESGSTRFCMGAAWREVRDNRDFDRVLDMVKGVNDMGMEVCCTLGMLTEEQALKLKKAGLM